MHKYIELKVCRLEKHILSFSVIIAVHGFQLAHNWISVMHLAFFDMPHGMLIGVTCGKTQVPDFLVKLINSRSFLHQLQPIMLIVGETSQNVDISIYVSISFRLTE